MTKFQRDEDAYYKATEYSCAMFQLDQLGAPTESPTGEELSIVGRIKALGRRMIKAESDLETIKLRYDVEV